MDLRPTRKESLALRALYLQAEATAQMQSLVGVHSSHWPWEMHLHNTFVALQFGQKGLDPI